jgi:soluble lytic murein transglycosylase
MIKPILRSSSVLFAILPLLLFGLTFDRLSQARLQTEATETRALEALQRIVARASPPPEAELRRVESDFPRTRAAGLARFLRGHLRYSAKDVAAAISILDDPVIEQKTELGDHALFLVASSLPDLNRSKEAEAALARLAKTFPDSLFARDAEITAAQLAAGQGDLRRAISHLSNLADRKDPAALLLMAQLYDKLGERRRALGLYQEIYFDLPPSREALDAEKQLPAAGLLGKGIGAIAYSRLRGRFEKLYQAGAYGEAVQVYVNFLSAYPEALKDDEVKLHYGRALFEVSSLLKAIDVLRSLKSDSPDIQSEGLYALAESYLRRGQTALFIQTSRALVKQFPESRWAAATLYSRAISHGRNDEDEQAVDAFKELLRLFPQSEYAPEATYRLGMKAYFKGDYTEAARRLISYAGRYVNSDYYGPALYWAGRAEERSGHPERALVIFERLVDRYRYTFYGQKALERQKKLRAKVENLQPAAPPPDSILGRALAQVKPAQPPAESLTEPARIHLKKAQDLRVIRLDELAAAELQTALRLAPDSRLVTLELARLYRDQGQYLTGINVLRRSDPEYTLYHGGEVSREVEELLFPLAHWKTITQESRRHGLDPYLVAGLIRQESGFDQNARSRANARGLMQLIPSTGRLVARRHGLGRITSARLYEPELNIRLGASFFANMIDRFGRIEYALAAYNGGPTRTARWVRELPNREIDEWIESIPIRETRLYVQAVIRNAAHYRRLYGQENGSRSSP